MWERSAAASRSHISKNLQSRNKDDYCDLRIWETNYSLFVLFSEEQDYSGISITNASGEIATAVNHAYLNNVQTMYSLSLPVTFFESYPYQQINNAPYFHQINYSTKTVNNQIIFSQPTWKDSTNEFINTLSKGKGQ